MTGVRSASSGSGTVSSSRVAFGLGEQASDISPRHFGFSDLHPPPSTFPHVGTAIDTHPEHHGSFDASLVVLDGVSTYYHLVSFSSKLVIF